MSIQKSSENSFSTMWILGLLLAVFVAWAMLFELDVIVKSQGQVIANSRTQVLQVADGGVLSELLVHEGALVKAGQTVAVLEKARASAALEESRVSSIATKAALIRARAEVANIVPQYGEEFKDYTEFSFAQRALYLQRKRTRDEELKTLREALVFARDEMEMTDRLYESKDVSRLEVIRAKRQVIDIDGRISAVVNKYLQDAQTEAAKLEQELASIEQKLSERQSVLDHTEIVAPVVGIVKYLKVTTIGGVLRAGDELMQISPTDDGLVIEAKINPADVGSLRLGLPVTVKLDAFDYSIYGMLNGELIHISPDTLTENAQNGQVMTYYRATVRLADNQLHNPKSKEMALKLGMTASLDIRTGRRSVMNYLAKPLFKTFHEALVER